MLFRKAILIIHGFAGGVYDEEILAHHLELNRNFDVYQFTLPGHDSKLKKVHYEDWIKKSEDMLNFLIDNGYNSIYLIGHSMGGVIATYLAVKYKQVKKLVLAAPAFQYLNVKKDNLNIKDSIKVTPKVIKTYGGEEIISRFLKLNPTALVEFMDLVKKYYDCPKELKCPLLIIQGKNDNLVPITSAEYVYSSAKSSLKRLIFVSSLTHDIFRGERKKEICNIVNEFLKHKEKGGIYNI